MVTDSGLWIKDEINNKKFIIKSRHIEGNYLLDSVINEFDNNFELIKKFDRRKIAQDYIDLAYGKVCGEKYDTPPVADPKFVENCESMWNENFREEELSSLESFF